MSELQRLKNDLQESIDALSTTAKRLKLSGAESVNAAADYELKKSRLKIEIAAEDATSGGKARTVAHIEAIYRAQFADERLKAQFKKMEYDTDVLLLKAIQSKLNAQQSLCRLTESEMKLGENFQ